MTTRRKFWSWGMRVVLAGAALRAAAVSAAATAGRMEGISSGWRLGAGGCNALAATQQPGGPIRSAAVLGEAWGCGLRLPGSAGLGCCNVGGRACQRPRGETVRPSSIRASGGSGLGLGGRVWVISRAGCAVGLFFFFFFVIQVQSHSCSVLRRPAQYTLSHPHPQVKGQQVGRLGSRRRRDDAR